MFGRKSRLAVVFAALSLALTACGSDGEPKTEPTVFAATPVEGGVPPQQEQITGGETPRAFPVLTEEADVRAFIQEFINTSLKAVKNPQPFEAEAPIATRIKGAAPCYKVPGAKKRVSAYKVGDKAPSSSPLVAACVHEGELTIVFARAKFYQYHLDHNVPEVRATIIRAVQEYLAQLARNKAGARPGYYAECAGGRLIGGLREAGLVEGQWANAQNVDGDIDTDAERIYVAARDEGVCPSRELGFQV